MKLLRNSFIVCLLAAFLPMVAQNVEISTPGMSLLLKANVGENLKFVYFGERLSDADAASLREVEPARYDAYPHMGSTVRPRRRLPLDMPMAI